MSNALGAILMWPSASMTTSSPAPETKRRRKRRIWLIVIAATIAIRIALPYVLLHIANDRLAKIPGYHGHIKDLDLALIRGAYQLDSFYLDRVDTVSLEHTPFLAARTIDLSVEWKALFDGGLVGELDVDEPMLRFTRGKAEPEEVQDDTASLGDLLKDFMPLRINRLAMANGRIEYVDESSKPRLDLALTQVNGSARNLSSVKDEDKLLPANIDATAMLYGGPLKFNMAMDPLSRTTLLDMNLSVEGMRLPEVNDFFRAYADFDVNKGTLSLYTEIATREGAFSGYVKPIIKDLDVLGKEDRKDNFLRKLWEGLVGTAGSLLTNPREAQVATKIPLSGRLDDPKMKSWVAIVSVLRNAFIRALEPAIDREINIGSPLEQKEEEKKGLLKSLFGKKDHDG